MRQKHYTNRHNQPPNRIQRPRNSTSSTISAISLRNAQLIHQNDQQGLSVSTLSMRSNNNNLTLANSPSHTRGLAEPSSRHTSSSVNERLASVGGLLSALSIIISGALLYAIFTVKSEDKFYYVAAILINITLLILLMVGAIVFDRLYAKKSTPPRPGGRSLARNLANNRVIEVTPSRYCPRNRVLFMRNASLQSNDEILNESNEGLEGRHASFLLRNDVPPKYPGFAIDSQAKISRESVRKLSTQVSTLTVSTTTAGDAKPTDEENIPSNPPPDYYELYPAIGAIQSTIVNETSENESNKDSTAPV